MEDGVIQNLNRKRKLCSDMDELAATPPKFPLLESVGQRFEQNRQEQQDRLDALKTRRETEKVHSRYLKNNVDCSKVELLQAECAANYWAKKHGVKSDPLTSKQRASPVRRAALLSRIPPSSSLNNQSSAPSLRMPSRPSQSKTTATNSQSNSTSTTNSQSKTTSATSSQSASNVASNTSRQTTTTTPTRNSRNNSNLSNNSSRSRSDSLIIVGSESATVETDSVNRSSSDTETVIDLDTSANASLVLVSDTLSHSPVPDRSNNAGSSMSQEEQNRCKVLSCEAKFSSEGALGQHMNLFNHSPCNPCLRAKNCKLSADPLFYMCPDCDREFQTPDECRSHMKAEKHSPYYPPLSVAGYMCAQCLYVFESFAACWNHIEDAAHKDICYPFADDLASHSSGVGPVAVIQELVDDMVKKCRNIAYRVQCLECSMEIENPAILRHHMLETDNRHLVSVLCDSSPVDVFAGYIAGYSCDKCRRLFNGDLKHGAKHDCAKGVIGTILENDVCSFFDFVKRCALSLIKSLESKDPSERNRPKPGPSNCSEERNARATATASARYSSPKRNQIELISSDDEEDDCILVTDTEDSRTDTDMSPSKKQGKKKKKRKRRKKKSKTNANANKDDTNGTAASAQNPVPCSNTPDIWEQLNGFAPATSESQTATSDQNTKGNQQASTSQTTAVNQSSTGNQQTSFPKAATENHNFPLPATYVPTHFAQQQFRCRPPLPLPAGLGLPCSSQSFGNMPLMAYPPPLLSNPPPPLLPNPPPPLLPHPPPPLIRPNNLLGAPLIRPSDTRMPFYAPRAPYTQGGPSLTQGRQRDQTHGLQQSGPRPGPNRDRTRTRSPVERQRDNPPVRERSRSPMESSLISTENLSRMRNIIFLDLDNWCSFFNKLPRALPDLTFVWGFYGGTRIWYEPSRCYIFNKMKSNGQYYLNEQCGNTKDAADFAIVLSVGKMDERLPSDVAFTILSGDRGFIEVERQMKSSVRKAVVINPHQAEKFSNEMIYTMVTSVTDT